MSKKGSNPPPPALSEKPPPPPSPPSLMGCWVRLNHDLIQNNVPVLMRRTGSPHIPMWEMWRPASSTDVKPDKEFWDGENS